MKTSVKAVIFISIGAIALFIVTAQLATSQNKDDYAAKKEAPVPEKQTKQINEAIIDDEAGIAVNVLSVSRGDTIDSTGLEAEDFLKKFRSLVFVEIEADLSNAEIDRVLDSDFDLINSNSKKREAISLTPEALESIDKKPFGQLVLNPLSTDKSESKTKRGVLGFHVENQYVDDISLEYFRPKTLIIGTSTELKEYKQSIELF